MRQLVVNGVVWSARIEILAEGAACQIEQSQLDSMQTPRQPKQPVGSKKTGS